MSAPVSVVIPVLDAAGRIGPCLGALVEGAAEGMVREVILADGGSSDDIAALAEGVGARLVAAPRGRGRQLAAGCRAATAPWLLVLHADTRLAPGWTDAVRSHLDRHPGMAAHARLRFDSTAAMARVTEGWANLRSSVFALPYGDQGLLIPRALHDAVGGYPEIALMEDVAIARAIGRRRMRPLATVATTSAERYEAEGWTRRGARNLWTLARYLAGADPERLAARYRSGR